MLNKNNPTTLVAKNLKYLLDTHKTNPTSVAAATKTNQSTLHRIIEGEIKEPRRKTLQPIADYFGISVDFLYNTDLKSNNENNTSPTNIPIRSNGLPLISWVQAGNWAQSDTSDVDEYRFTNRRHSKYAYALRVRGISMYNPGNRESFEDGDIILVDPEKPFNNGSLVIALLESGETTFKKLYIEDGMYYLKALNPEWKPKMIALDSPTSICGVVFEKQVDF